MRKFGLIIAIIAACLFPSIARTSEAPASVRELVPQKTEAVFFFKQGSIASERVLEHLIRLKEKYSEFSFLKFNINDPETVLFCKYLNKIPLAPAVMIGEIFLSKEEDLTSIEIERYVRKYRFREVVSTYGRFLEDKAKTAFKGFAGVPVFKKILSFVYTGIAGIFFILACLALIDFVGYSRGVKYKILLQVPIKQKRKIVLFFCFLGLGAIFVFLL